MTLKQYAEEVWNADPLMETSVNGYDAYVTEWPYGVEGESGMYQMTEYFISSESGFYSIRTSSPMNDVQTNQKYFDIIHNSFTITK